MKTLSFLLLFLLVIPSAVSAERGSTHPIYVVDMQRVIDESIVGKAAKSDIEAEVKKGEGEVKLLRREVEQMEAETDKQSALLSAQALQDRRDALAKKGREFARAVQDKREELNRKNSAHIEKVVKEIDVVVKEMAKKEGYEFVIERDSQYVVYVAPGYDLTKRVIEELNRRKLDL